MTMQVTYSQRAHELVKKDSCPHKLQVVRGLTHTQGRATLGTAHLNRLIGGILDFILMALLPGFHLCRHLALHFLGHGKNELVAESSHSSTVG